MVTPCCHHGLTLLGSSKSWDPRILGPHTFGIPEFWDLSTLGPRHSEVPQSWDPRILGAQTHNPIETHLRPLKMNNDFFKETTKSFEKVGSNKKSQIISTLFDAFRWKPHREDQHRTIFYRMFWPERLHGIDFFRKQFRLLGLKFIQNLSNKHTTFV